MEITNLIPTILFVIGLFLLRNVIAAWIKEGIRHDFSVQIENLRAELRQNEEQVKSELRAREAEIALLRGTVLDGRAQRLALLDRRRLEAAERVWKSVVQLGVYKLIALHMSMLKYEAAAREAKNNQRFRDYIDLILNQAPDPNKATDTPAVYERPFLSQPAWAYYSAYQMIMVTCWWMTKALALGMPEGREFVDLNGFRNLLKAVLPHRSAFIDRSDAGGFYSLLDELEAKILEELRKSLDGAELDSESLAQAAKIMDAVHGLRTEREAKEVESTNMKPPAVSIGSTN